MGLALPEVLVEYGGGGPTWYLHLPHSIATDDGTAWTYSAADGLGSVRQQLDSSGDVDSVLSYRPFGSPLEGNGGDPYGYTGEWWNSYIKLSFLRARWYDPRNARFLSPDTIIPDYSYPPSIHQYSYVYNNAINLTDPSGHTVKCPEPSERDISSLPGWAQDAAALGCSLSGGCRVRQKADGSTVIRTGGAELCLEATESAVTGLANPVGVVGGGSGTQGLFGRFAQRLKSAVRKFGEPVLEFCDDRLARIIQPLLRRNNVWDLPWSQRGRVIEDLLNRNLPRNFPVIDRFENGMAVSIKSLDINAQTYQNIGRLRSKVQTYINQVAVYQGQPARWAGVQINPEQITGRALELAIPSGASQAQLTALQGLRQAANNLGVQLRVVVVR